MGIKGVSMPVIKILETRDGFIYGVNVYLEPTGCVTLRKMQYGPMSAIEVAYLHSTNGQRGRLFYIDRDDMQWAFERLKKRASAKAFNPDRLFDDLPSREKA